MCIAGECKFKNEEEAEPQAESWEEKKYLADKKEEILKKNVKDFRTWIEKIDTMNDQQLKEYIKNHRSRRLQRVQRLRNFRSSTSNRIMASIWKFHGF